MRRKEPHELLETGIGSLSGSDRNSWVVTKGMRGKRDVKVASVSTEGLLSTGQMPGSARKGCTGEQGIRKPAWLGRGPGGPCAGAEKSRRTGGGSAQGLLPMRP